MRVAFIIQDLIAQGAQAATALMANGFRIRGFDVDLIVSRVHDDMVVSGAKSFEVVPDVHWIRLKDRKARNNVIQLRKYLSATDAVAVIAMSPNYSDALRIASVCLRRCPRLVHVEHGLASCNDRGEREPYHRKWTMSAIRHGIYWSKFDSVLVVSNAAVNDFMGVNPWYNQNRIHVVNNPVVDDKLLAQRELPPLHPWLREKTLPTIVTAGAYTENKNHMLLLRAFRSAVMQAPARLIIFGKGNLEGEYKMFVKENHLENLVSIAGYTYQFPAEAAAADGFVCSSKTESFGIVLVQAMAAGCPVVSTDAPFGPREVLGDGKFGVLVRNEDEAELSKAIIHLARGEIAPAPENSWQRYTVDATVDKYVK